MNLPIIEFEGVKVKPTKIGYKCPFKCGRSDYPQQKWKTEQGFRKHTTECSKRPSLLQRINENREVEKEAFENIKKKILSETPYIIGNEVIFIKKIVVKPTHEQRGNRLVRVRYEPILRFEAKRETIQSVDILQSNPNYYPTDYDYIKSQMLFLNNYIHISDIVCNWDEAVKIAKEKTQADEDYRKMASSYR